MAGIGRRFGVSFALVAIATAGLSGVTAPVSSAAATAGDQAKACSARPPVDPPLWEQSLPTADVASASDSSDPRCVHETKRLANAVVWRNPDGSLTARGYSSPVNYQTPDGAWRGIDTRLVDDGKGSLVNKAGPFGARFAQDGAADSLVTVDDHGASLSLRFEGALGKDGTIAKPQASHGVISGDGTDTVTYPDSLANTDLQYQLLPTALKEAIVLQQPLADGLTPQFSFTAALKVLKADTADDGTIRFVNTDTGKTVFTVPSGVATDSSGNADKGTTSASAPVSVTLVNGASADLATLVVSVDSKWLNDPSRVFPVTIDPTLDNTTGGNITADAYVADTSSTTTFDGASQYDSGTSHYWDRAGTTGGTTYNSYQALPSFAFMRNQKVVSATWNGYAYSIGGGTSVALTLKPASAAWSVGGTTPVTWSNQPALRTNSATATYTAGSQWKSASITSWVTSWAKDPASGGWAEDGIRLSAPTTKVVNIAAQEAPAAQQPYVDVVYDAYPTMSNYTAGGKFTAGTINSSTPALQVQIDDSDSGVDGQQLTGNFELWNSTHTTQLQTGTGSIVQSGQASGWTPTTLTDGTYTWRAKATDGVVTTAAWSAWQTLKVDTVVPATPSICTMWGYTTNTWTPAGSKLVVINESPTSDAYQFLWGLDVGNSPTTLALPSGGTASALTVPSAGWHDLACQTVDSAGNVSTVAHFTFGSGDGGFTQPATDFDTQKNVPVEVISRAAYDGITLQWRHAEASAWTTIPVTDVTYQSTGTAVSAWPVTATPGSPSTTFPNLIWNATATSGIDGPLQLRIKFYTGATFQADSPDSDAPNIKLDQAAFGAGYASVPAGPGQVNLLTGNLELTSGDVSLAGGGVSRTFQSRDPNIGGLFGPGWSSSITSGTAKFRSLTDNGDNAVVTSADGSLTSFRKQPDGSYLTEPGNTFLTLTSTSPTAFTLSVLAFETYTFTHIAGSPAGFYEVSAVDDASGTGAWAVSWAVSSGVTRPTRIVGPAPPSVSCASPLTTRGCQTLEFDYGATTAATSICGSPLGDVAGQLRTVHYTAWDPDLSTPAMHTVDVATYCYNTTSTRLVAEWDPRITPGLKTVYAYDSDGHVSSITPPGLNAVSFVYAPIGLEPASTGRLSTVSRVMPVGATPTNTNAIATYRYQIPLTTAAGGPYDLDSTSTAAWAQHDNPVDATAIYPADQTPSGTPPSSYTGATVLYMNLEGQTVNVASAGGYIATSEHDAIGNEIRTLTPANRALALATGSSAADHASQARLIDKLTVFDPDGWNITDTYGPAHLVDLPDGSRRVARAHGHSVYDEAAPGGAHYGLVTTQTESAAPIDGSSEQDIRTTSNAYAIGADNAGWTLGTPLQVTVDPGTGTHLNLTTTTKYDTATGLMTARILPANPSGGDAHETQFIYYTAGTNSADSACGNHPEWATLACKTLPSAQPGTSGLPNLHTTQMTKYSMYGAAEETIDTNGSDSRTSTITYDGAGRALTQSVVATVGTAIPTSTNAYDATTGMPTTTSDGTRTITRTYNAVGSMSTYQDADGNTSSTTYDLLGRPSTQNDGKATTTYTYDDVNGEHRGLLTTISDSQVGVFTAQYDADGSVNLETFPGGKFWRATGRNEAGQVQTLAYFDCLCGSNHWPVLSASYDIHGQQTQSSQGLENFAYTYDPAGRLTHTNDTFLFGCGTRAYGFDADTNRTSLGKASGTLFSGPCPPSAAPTTTNSTYDAADRATTSGYGYDAFGRTTTVPAADSPSGNTTTLGYYASDTNHTITALGTTVTYNLGPNHQIRTWSSSADGQTRTNHFVADGDSPSWTTENSAGTIWTRHVLGFGGLGADVDQSGTIALRLANIHGDIFSSVPTSETDWVAGINAGTSTWSGTDEYGVAESGGTSVGTRYDFEGSHQRSRDTNSGMHVMGVRVFDSTSGRFLQNDPVIGGGSNSYDYTAGDPVGREDLSGECWHIRPTWGYVTGTIYTNRCTTKTLKGFGTTEFAFLTGALALAITHPSVAADLGISAIINWEIAALAFWIGVYSWVVGYQAANAYNRGGCIKFKLAPFDPLNLWSFGIDTSQYYDPPGGDCK